jgi:hypothetical protein
MKILSLTLALLAAAPALAQQSDRAPNPFDAGQNPRASTAGAPAPAQASPRASRARSTPAAAGQYASLPEAQHACGTDPVVWGNTNSHVYHPQGAPLFGKTKHGAYLCQGAAGQAGFHAAGQRRQRG